MEALDLPAPSSSAYSPSQNYETALGSDDLSTSPHSSKGSLSHGHESPDHAHSFSSSQDADADADADGDLDRHPKGKRKRTAAKDKAILEAAYTSNPKPDKAARLDIVRRVSLNEKEVQIWFQNRRQNDRRKSRPLSPQEVAALRYGGMHIVSSEADLGSPVRDQSQAHAGGAVHATSPIAIGPIMTTPLPSPDRDPWLPGKFEKMLEEHGIGFKRRTLAGVALETTPSSQRAEASESSQGSLQLSHSFSSGPVGYLANRWNPASSFSTPISFGHRQGGDDPPLPVHIELGTPATTSPSCPPTSTPVLPPPTPQRHFRLSLSLEGKAELKTDASPSPERPAPPPSSSAPNSINANTHLELTSTLNLATIAPLRRPNSALLQRSRSAVTLPPISALTGPLGALTSRERRARGRSRDVLAWECAADAETRADALTAQAARESNPTGSAVAAISLLRSHSSHGAAASPVLQPNANKRNSPWSARAAGGGAAGGKAKRPKLARANSTVARLPGHKVVEFDPAAAAAGRKGKEGKGGAGVLRATSGHDSDKENWSPDEDGNPNNPHSHIGTGTPTLPPSSSTAPRRAASPTAPVRKPLPSGTGPAAAARRGVLTDLRGPALGRANTAPAGVGRRAKAAAREVAIFEDGTEAPRRGADHDDEVARFMRGGMESPSKEAVAGLLSLSQGNWR